MKNTLWFCLLVTLPCCAQADWVQVSTTQQEYSVYVDAASVTANGDFRKVSVLFDMPKPESLPGLKHSFSSYKVLAEINCKEIEFRKLATAFFTGHMAQGEIVIDDKEAESTWKSVPPGSVGSRFVTYACAERELGLSALP